MSTSGQSERRSRWIVRVVCGCALAAAAACSGAARGADEPKAAVGYGELAGATFRWLSAQCVDGALELAKSGFERTLRTDVHGSVLHFTYDTQLVQPDCASTEVWKLTRETAGQFAFTPEATVSLPLDVACGPHSSATEHGVLRLNGDTLEELRFGSSWCRGFDARFVYRRVPSAALTDDELIRHYAAHWNRRDAAALAGLFSERGVLIEPFTRSADGSPVRHEGRADIEQWLQGAFASTPWLALQLRGIVDLDEHGQSIALWHYRDPRLAETLSGRNLFLLAGGEIFTTELQLLSEPVAVSTR